MSKTPKPSTKAQIDPNFQKQVQKLVQDAARRAAAIEGAPPAAMVPEDWDGDVRNIVGLGEPFDRQDLNQQYADAHQDAAAPGTVGDVVAIKLQIDYLAMMERSFRIRHSSPIRDICHMFARHKGHGNGKGVFQNQVLGHVQDAIAAGAS